MSLREARVGAAGVITKALLVRSLLAARGAEEHKHFALMWGLFLFRKPLTVLIEALPLERLPAGTLKCAEC